MDDDRFDAWTRRIANLGSRRRRLAGAAGSLVAAVATAVGIPPASAGYGRGCTLPSGRRGLLCAGVCRDVSADPKNCGRCGGVCPSGTFCCNGTCADPAHNSPSCCPPQRLCGGACVSPASDPDNCGACGVTCGTNQDCCGGQCLTRGTAANCAGCAVCSGRFVCDPNANGPGALGCVCPLGIVCAID